MELFDSSLALRTDSIPRHIHGITCDAKNCVYHDGDHYCTASKVSIGNVTALATAETRCATFICRNDLTRR